MTDQPKKPHTPLPWLPKWEYEAGWIHSPSSQHVIAKMIHEVGIVGPDAEFICRAVNCFDALVAASEAALRYDSSILGRAATGKCDELKESGGAMANGEDLDSLYFDWQTKAATAMEQVRKWSQQ